MNVGSSWSTRLLSISLPDLSLRVCSGPDGHRVADRRPEQVAAVVEWHAVGLDEAAQVGCACPELVWAGCAWVPVEVPTDPGAGQVRPVEVRVLPARPTVRADFHAADGAVTGPRATSQQERPAGRKLCVPCELERAFHSLFSQRRLVRRIARPGEAVGGGVPG